MASRRPPQKTALAPISARRKASLIRRLPHPASVMAYDGGWVSMPLDTPSASLTACSVPLVVTSGKTQKMHGVTTHAGPNFQFVTYMCNGFKFGGGATVSFIPIADGHSFTGVQHFCKIKKCSNGKPSTSFATVSGTATSLAGIATVEMVYDCRAFCGEDVVCLEEGSFRGTTSKAVPDPLHADFIGIYEWTLTCCPDVTWDDSLSPV